MLNRKLKRCSIVCLLTSTSREILRILFSTSFSTLFRTVKAWSKSGSSIDTTKYLSCFKPRPPSANLSRRIPFISWRNLFSLSPCLNGKRMFSNEVRLSELEF